MATNNFIVIEGLSAATATLNGLPKQIQRSAINAAARKASKPLIAEARTRLVNLSLNSNDGATEGAHDRNFSKALFASRYIKAVNKRASGIPGVRVLFKGPAVPMNEGKSRSYDLQGYTKLMAYGSHKVGKRSHKSGKNVGKSPSHGNFIVEAFDKVGPQVDIIFSLGLLNEMNRALDRALRRTAKKLI
jgi:hypothetical protein